MQELAVAGVNAHVGDPSTAGSREENKVASGQLTAADRPAGFPLLPR